MAKCEICENEADELFSCEVEWQEGEMMLCADCCKPQCAICGITLTGDGIPERTNGVERRICHHCNNDREHKLKEQEDENDEYYATHGE